MWFLCLSYCLMLPCWTGMSRANSVTLARMGSSAETCHRQEPPHKGQLLARVVHQELNGDPQHTHMILWPPPRNILLHPLGYLSLLKWRHFSWLISPPVVILSLISGCTGWQAASEGRPAPFHICELIWITPPSHWRQGRIRNILQGEKPHKNLS